MKTELAKKAFQRMKLFKKDCTPKQWEIIQSGIKEFDNLLTGSGFYAIQSKQKLNKMLEFSYEDFKAFQFLNPN